MEPDHASLLPVFRYTPVLPLVPCLIREDNGLTFIHDPERAQRTHDFFGNFKTIFGDLR